MRCGGSCYRREEAYRTCLARGTLVSVEVATREPRTTTWTRRHLLDLEDLSRSEIETILDTADSLVEASQRRRKKLSTLKGKVVLEGAAPNVKAPFEMIQSPTGTTMLMNGSMCTRGLKVSRPSM